MLQTLKRALIVFAILNVTAAGGIIASFYLPISQDTGVVLAPTIAAVLLIVYYRNEKPTENNHEQ